jgi:hypothetical protein
MSGLFSPAVVEVQGEMDYGVNCFFVSCLVVLVALSVSAGLGLLVSLLSGLGPYYIAFCLYFKKWMRNYILPAFIKNLIHW